MFGYHLVVVTCFLEGNYPVVSSEGTVESLGWLNMCSYHQEGRFLDELKRLAAQPLSLGCDCIHTLGFDFLFSNLLRSLVPFCFYDLDAKIGHLIPFSCLLQLLKSPYGPTKICCSLGRVAVLSICCSWCNGNLDSTKGSWPCRT